MRGLCLAVVLLVTNASLAAAAVVKEDVIGCRNEEDLKRPATGVTKKSAMRGDVNKTGACAPLNRGVTVSVDQKKGDLLCVRLYGGLDCFWTPSTAINQNPVAPDKEQTFGGSKNFKPVLNGTMPGMQTSF
jgi:hypothetical protein